METNSRRAGISKKVTVKQLPSHLDLGKACECLREIKPVLLHGERPYLVLDFSHVRQIDGAGVEMLVECIEIAMKRDGDVKLAAVAAEVNVILQLTRVDRLFEMFDTAAQAVESFHRFPIHSAGQDARSWESAPALMNGKGDTRIKVAG
jgi:anti-sigma B factor antagonist